MFPVAHWIKRVPGIKMIPGMSMASAGAALAGTLFVGMSPALAQQPAPAPAHASAPAPASVPAPAPAHTSPAAQAGAAGDISADNMILAALRIMAVLNAGRSGEVYDAASPALKQSVSRDVFMANIAKFHEQYGVPSRHIWTDVARLIVPEPQGKAAQGALPPGNYISIRFLATFGTRPPINELVSFRDDGAGHFNLSGFGAGPVAPPQRAPRR